MHFGGTLPLFIALDGSMSSTTAKITKKRVQNKINMFIFYAECKFLSHLIIYYSLFPIFSSFTIEPLYRHSQCLAAVLADVYKKRGSLLSYDKWLP